MGLWKNSAYIKKGDYFLIDKDNEKYVSDAIKNGCIKIITELDNTYEVETQKVDNVNEYLKKQYDFSDIKLIGITGTNGKTTTCFLIYQMLNFLGIKTAYIGTIGFYIDDKIMDLDKTTPSVDMLYHLINIAKINKCEIVVMEVSSHALDQNRLYGILFDIVGVTNISKEHLNYHKSMKGYINSKRKLISMTTNNKICILNKDDKYYKKFINKNNKNVFINKNTFKDIKLSLIVDFNTYNFNMACMVVKQLEYDYNKVLKNSSIFTEPPGRMDKIIYKNSVIVIDYAHSPEAILKVLKMFKKIYNRGIITIIGCSGNKDHKKRYVIGKIVTKYSKYVIFTDDNPGYERPEDITDDLKKYAKSNYIVIHNRKEAIKKGINVLRESMILLILGKGHETHQIINNEKTYFSDKEEVLNIINNEEDIK